MSSSPSRWALAVCLTAAFLRPLPVHAQESDEKLAVKLQNLYIQNFISNLEIFGIDPAQAENLLEQLLPAFAISQALGAQISSFPLGSSAGGFSWTFDPNVGTFNRVTQSFGPMFAERAMTVGRHRLNVGINVQRTTFDRFEDRDLPDGGIKTYFGVQEGGAQIFVEDSLHLKVATTTVGLFATYGITDRLDAGIAVPITAIKMNARLDSRLGINNTLDPEVFFTNGVTGSETAIADIVLRGKYIIWPAKGGGLAAGVDLRLPTGDEENWLGVAGTQSKFYAAASTAIGRTSPHFNFGYTLSTENSLAKDPDSPVFPPPDEITYTAGVDSAITNRLTVVGDLLGRTLLDFGEFVDTASQFGTNYRQLSLGREDASLHLLLGSVGVKYNIHGSSLIAFNVLFPLNDNGLRDKLTWIVGFEHSLGLRR